MNLPSKSNPVLKMHLPKVHLILDPHKMEDAYSMALVLQLFRGLLRYDPRGDVVLDLAQSWEESPDHKIYRIKLRPSTFSDGTAISPVHVQMSFARMFNLGASMGADLDYIEGVAKFKQTKLIADLGIKPISQTEVEFRLSRPSSLFLKHLAVVDCAILPLTEYQGKLDLTPKGAFSGPYKIVRQDDDSGIDLIKWRTDLMDSKHPPQVVQYTLTDENGSDLAKRQLTDSLDRDAVPESARNEFLAHGWTAHPTGLTGEEFVVLNPEMIPAATRKFLYSQIDSEALLQILAPSRYLPAFGVIPFGVPGELSKSERDAVLKGLSSESLKPEKGKVLLEYDENNPTEQKVVDYLLSVWKAPGLAIETKALPKREKLKRMFSKQCQACLARKGLDYPDGYSVLTYFKGGYESNYFHVADSEIDHALTDLVQIFDSKRREERYREIQIKILKHFTIIPLFFGTDAAGLWSSKVAQVPQHPMGYHTLPLETVELR